MPGMHLMQQKIDEIKELESLGFTRKDIASQLGICEDTIRAHLPRKQKEHVKVTYTMVEKMKELRDKGLSNSQIAKELNTYPSIIRKYIGNQPDMARAEYGSIVAHTTGESFEEKANAQSNEVQAPVGRKLKTLRTSVCMEGERFKYEMTTDGDVTITPPNGFSLNFDRKGFFRYLSELGEISNWLKEHAKFA